MAPTARVVVTGATGYLGPHVLGAVAAAGAVAVAPRSADLDVTQPGAMAGLLASVRPAAVLHLAAVNPGRGEAARMPAVNHTGAALVAEACAAAGVRLVHTSTDVVLAGSPPDAPYPDGAPAAPRNPYGASKAAGEAAVLAALPSAVVARTSLVYALDTPDRATAGCAARLAEGATVTLFADVWRQPVEAGDLATALVALALRHPAVGGLLNLAGEQPATREQFGRRLLDLWAVPGRDRVRAAPVADPTVPVDLRLRFDRAHALGLRLRGLDEVLATG